MDYLRRIAGNKIDYEKTIVFLHYANKPQWTAFNIKDIGSRSL